MNEINIFEFDKFYRHFGRVFCSYIIFLWNKGGLLKATHVGKKPQLLLLCPEITLPKISLKVIKIENFVIQLKFKYFYNITIIGSAISTNGTLKIGISKLAKTNRRVRSAVAFTPDPKRQVMILFV